MTAPAPTTTALPSALVAGLSTLLGDRFSTGLADREHHGHGESWHPRLPPQAVCRALTTSPPIL